MLGCDQNYANMIHLKMQYFAIYLMNRMRRKWKPLKEFGQAKNIYC